MRVCVWTSLKQNWAYGKSLPFWMVIKERFNHCQSALAEFLITWHRLSVSDQLPITLSLNVFFISLHVPLQHPDDPVSHICVSREFILLSSDILLALLVATFKFWLPSHPETRYSNHSNAPANCCSAEHVLMSHSQSRDLSVCLSGHPSTLSDIQCFICLFQMYYENMSSLSVTS